MVRFFLAAEAVTLASIELVPGGEEKDSYSYPYERDLNGIPLNGGKARVRLGQPIIEVTGLEVFDEDLLQKHKEVLRRWLEIERSNLVRACIGLRRIHRPDSFLTNVPPKTANTSRGLGGATEAEMSGGLRWLREAVEVIGSQLEYRKQRDGAVLMAMADRWLQRRFPDVFKHDVFANGGPGFLSYTVSELGRRFQGTYVFAGVDALLDHIAHVALGVPEQSAQLSPLPVTHAEPPPAEDPAVSGPPSTPNRANLDP
jgi:hypothetical protein